MQRLSISSVFLSVPGPCFAFRKLRKLSFDVHERLKAKAEQIEILMATARRLFIYLFQKRKPTRRPNTLISQVVQQTLHIQKTSQVLLDLRGNYPTDIVDRSGAERVSGGEINPLHFN